MQAFADDAVTVFTCTRWPPSTAVDHLRPAVAPRERDRARSRSTSASVSRPAALRLGARGGGGAAALAQPGGAPAARMAEREQRAGDVRALPAGRERREVRDRRARLAAHASARRRVSPAWRTPPPTRRPRPARANVRPTVDAATDDEPARKRMRAAPRRPMHRGQPTEIASRRRALDAARAPRYSERAVRAAPDPAVLVLASASPRRRELLAGAGVALRGRARRRRRGARGSGEAPERAASAARAREGAGRARSPPERPRRARARRRHGRRARRRDPRQAARRRARGARCCAALVGRTHRVLTGRGARRAATGAAALRVASVESRVTLRAGRARRRSRAYVATGEPLDKAGAYALQGEGRRFVSRVEGSETQRDRPAARRDARAAARQPALEPRA